MTSRLCILGASGFVGARTLRRARSSAGAGVVRILLHQRSVLERDAVEAVHGDATDVGSLERLLDPGAVVLNFAYAPDGKGEQIAQALSAACARQRIRRLVHVSTCSVYGRTPEAVITEDAPCQPATLYERSKHAIEEILKGGAQDRYELAVLRPAAVFGPGGKNLETLARRVLTQAWPRRYLRACVMGRRSMHAVDVDCVAAAALFLASAPMSAPIEDFIVSQDDEPANDYMSLEAYFVRRFGAAAYPFPPLALPPGLFSVALRMAGRSVTDPRRCYSPAKLEQRGFRRPRRFEEALEEYAAWFERRESDPVPDARP